MSARGTFGWSLSTVGLPTSAYILELEHYRSSPAVRSGLSLPEGAFGRSLHPTQGHGARERGRGMRGLPSLCDGLETMAAVPLLPPVGEVGVVESDIAEAGLCVDVGVGVGIAVGIGRGGIAEARHIAHKHHAVTWWHVEDGGVARVEDVHAVLGPGATDRLAGAISALGALAVLAHWKHPAHWVFGAKDVREETAALVHQVVRADPKETYVLGEVAWED